MRANIEKLENNKVKLEIEVDAGQFDDAVQKAYFKNRGHIAIPGFRKGKAPRKIIENYYGEGVFYEDAINEIIPTAYSEAIEENEIFPVDQPDMDIVQVGEGQNLIFNAEVTVKPEVELGQYKGIEINKVEYNVTDQDIDDQLHKVRDQNARWISVEDRTVEEGDRVTIDYKGYVDGEAFEGGTAENQSLEIGSGAFIPGFEEQLIGMNIGDEGDIEVVFPEEYHSEDLKGKKATFNVKIHEIKEKELPDLDDELIKDISEFDTIDEYKADLRKNMEKDSEERAKAEMESQLLEKVAENAKIDIPEVMVESEIDVAIRDMDMRMQYQGMDLNTYLGIINTTMDDFRTQFKDEAYNRVKLQLTMEEIVGKESIEATNQELEDEYAKIAEQYNLDIDRVKEEYGSQEAEVKRSIAVRKAIDYLMAQAVVVKAPKETEGAKAKEESEVKDEAEVKEEAKVKEETKDK